MSTFATCVVLFNLVCCSLAQENKTYGTLQIVISDPGVEPQLQKEGDYVTFVVEDIGEGGLGGFGDADLSCSKIDPTAESGKSPFKQNRTLDYATFANLETATLNFGVWPSPVRITLVDSSGQISDGDQFAADNATKSMDMAVNGIYNFDVTFALVESLTDAKIAAKTFPGCKKSRTKTASTGVGVSQEFKPTVDGLVYSVGVWASNPENQYLGVTVTSGATSQLEAFGRSFFSDSCNDTIQIELDPPLVVKAGETYTIHTDANGSTTSSVKLYLANTCGADESPCTLASGISCEAETALHFDYYVRPATGCIEKCLVESGTESVRAACGLGCSNQVVGWNEDNCTAAACASGSPLCSESVSKAAVTAGCRFGNSTAGAHCDVTSLEFLLGQNVEIKGSTTLTFPSQDKASLECVKGELIATDPARVSAYLCSGDTWHAEPAGAQEAICLAVCTLTELRDLFKEKRGGPDGSTRNYELPIGDGTVTEGSTYYANCGQDSYEGNITMECTSGGWVAQDDDFAQCRFLNRPPPPFTRPPTEFSTTLTPTYSPTTSAPSKSPTNKTTTKVTEQSSSTSDDGGGTAGIVVLIVILIIALVVVGVIYRRKKAAIDRMDDQPMVNQFKKEAGTEKIALGSMSNDEDSSRPLTSQATKHVKPASRPFSLLNDGNGVSETDMNSPGETHLLHGDDVYIDCDKADVTKAIKMRLGSFYRGPRDTTTDGSVRRRQNTKVKKDARSELSVGLLSQEAKMSEKHRMTQKKVAKQNAKVRKMGGSLSEDSEVDVTKFVQQTDEVGC